MNYEVFMNVKKFPSNLTLKSGEKIGVGYPNSHIVYRASVDKDGSVSLSFQYIV